MMQNYAILINPLIIVPEFNFTTKIATAENRKGLKSQTIP